MSERMVQHGIISKLRVRYELCSAHAEVEKEVIWVPASLAAKQGKIISDYEQFQEELSLYKSRRSPTGDTEK